MTTFLEAIRKPLWYAMVWACLGCAGIAPAANAQGGGAAAPTAAPAPPETPVSPSDREGLSAGAEDPAEIDVETVAFATAISSRHPVGQATWFDGSVERVYCWNRILARRPPVRIRHIWYFNGKNVGEFVLPIHHRRARVWTHKAVQPGHWRVDITDEAGNPLTVATFPVRPPAVPAPMGPSAQ